MVHVSRRSPQSGCKHSHSNSSHCEQSRIARAAPAGVTVVPAAARVREGDVVPTDHRSLGSDAVAPGHAALGEQEGGPSEASVGGEAQLLRWTLGQSVFTGLVKGRQRTEVTREVLTDNTRLKTQNQENQA